MSQRTLAVIGALLIVVAVPAGAQAATLEPLKPCYVTAGTADAPQAELVNLRAAGFTPNARVDLALDGAVVQPGLITDEQGALGVLSPVQVRAPFIAFGSRPFTVTLTESGNPANFATATARTVALRVGVKPRRARPSRVIRFRGAGFTADNGVYAHYVYKGKVRKTVRMASEVGECGEWTAHRRQIPVRNPGTGVWTVQFDQHRGYRKQPTTVYVRLSIEITRTFG